ncbi:MAG: coenzyme F420-0:L-glutamate ligase [Caldisphaera sp.]|jgi:coenzyme F420-0:L-glutamate ligase/coenzyme F420-1:gamma-L-glutamate ligase|nr:MAG: hypothetical protein C0201_03340 [Caldisphaera sp.]
MVELLGLHMPEIKSGDDLSRLIYETSRKEYGGLKEYDIIAITSKVVSKSKSYIININSLKPSQKAIEISNKSSMDSKWIELLLRESDDILAVLPVKEFFNRNILNLKNYAYNIEDARQVLDKYPYLFLTRRSGLIWTDSGIDSSNVPDDLYAIPPKDPDFEAETIWKSLSDIAGKKIAIVICDTEVSLNGASLDRAIGCYGIKPIDSGFGKHDIYGKPKYGGVDNIADEICSSAALILKQTDESIPAIIIRGLKYEFSDKGLKYYRLDSEKAMEAVKLIVTRTGMILGYDKFLKFLKLL